jgi:hypothetical protein
VQRLVLSSGKVVLLDKLLTRLKETGHRVLTFSQISVACHVVLFFLSAMRVLGAGVLNAGGESSSFSFGFGDFVDLQNTQKPFQNLPGTLLHLKVIRWA